MEIIKILNAVRKIIFQNTPYPIIGICLEGDAYLRLNATKNLYQQGKLKKIIVSGGNYSSVTQELPAQKMKDWLIDHGVLSEDIILEPNSRHTGEHPKYVSSLIGYDPILVITSGFHALRAYFSFTTRIENRIYIYVADSFFDWFKRDGRDGIRLFAALTELKKISRDGYLD